MRMIHAVFVLTLTLPLNLYAAQAPTDAPAAPVTATSLLKPSLDNLQQTVSALKTEKWKGGTVRQEAQANIQSIQHDIDTNLPPLLSTADAAPGSVSKALPVLRNIDALYDVVLRVVEAARVTAPRDQIGALEQAMTGLEGSRRALGDRLQAAAASQERQFTDLQTKLQTPPPAPTPAPCVPPPPAAKPAPKKKRKPAIPSTSPAATKPAAAKP